MLINISNKTGQAAPDARVDGLVKTQSQTLREIFETDQWVSEIETTVASIQTDFSKLRQVSLNSEKAVQQTIGGIEERLVVFENYTSDRLDALRKMIPVYEVPRPYDDSILLARQKSLQTELHSCHTLAVVRDEALSKQIKDLASRLASLERFGLVASRPWYKRIFNWGK